MITLLNFNKKFNFFEILFLSLPILLVFSRFLLEISLIIISIYFLICVFKDKEFFYFNNFLFKFAFIFYLYLLFNHIIQANKLETSVIFYFRYSIYALSIYYLLSKKNELFINFLKVIFFLVLILSIDTVFQFIFDYNLIGLKVIEDHRMSSFFGNELVLGGFTFRIMPFIFMFFIFKNKFFNNQKIYLALFLSYLLIILSGERIAFVSSVLVGFFYLIFLNIENKKKLFMKISIVFALLFLSLMFFSKSYQNRYYSRIIDDLNSKNFLTKSMLSKENLDKRKIIFLSGLHHNMLLTSYNIFKNNFFFGSGPRSYRIVCLNKNYRINDYSCQNHPHNFTMQILAELGIVGFLFYLILYFFILREIWISRAKKNREIFAKLCILGFLFITFMPLAPSGNFFNNWLSIMIYLPVGFYLYLDKLKKYNNF